MKVKITHPIIRTVARETTAYPAGKVFDVADTLAEEWIALGWAYQLKDKESPEREPLPAAEVKRKARRRSHG